MTGGGVEDEAGRPACDRRRLVVVDSMLDMQLRCRQSSTAERVAEWRINRHQTGPGQARAFPTEIQ